VLLQKLNVKMDLVVAGISDLKERMVKLEDLPAQVRAGFKDVGSQISSFRKMVLQVRLHESGLRCICITSCLPLLHKCHV
jgi:hypothetical protein